jgi:hypothetical protein
MKLQPEIAMYTAESVEKAHSCIFHRFETFRHVDVLIFPFHAYVFLLIHAAFPKVTMVAAYDEVVRSPSVEIQV